MIPTQPNIGIHSLDPLLSNQISIKTILGETITVPAISTFEEAVYIFTKRFEQHFNVTV